MAKPLVQIKDMGLKRIVMRTVQLGGITISAGIQSDAGKGSSGVPIAEYAFYNEFGTDKIPSRPFLRRAFDSSIGSMNDRIKHLTLAVQDGKISPRRAGSEIGEMYVKRIQAFIRSNMSPANAPSTVKNKGFNRTLIQEGDMLRAVSWKFEPRGVGVR